MHGATHDRCLCELADRSGCHPGAARCEDDESLQWCNEGQAWELHDCEQLCAMRGLASDGCSHRRDGDACMCTSEGTPCTRGDETSCADEQTLARCEAGQWVFDRCPEMCSDFQATCVAGFEEPRVACSCDLQE